MEKYQTVDEYIAKASTESQPLLKQLRQIIRQNAPEAEESISYGMPAYKYSGRPLVYFGGFKNHVSLFATASQRVAKKFSQELGPYKKSKGTIQFQLNEPLPTELIRKIVRERVDENEGQSR